MTAQPLHPNRPLTPLTFYARRIMEILGVDEREARILENAMRHGEDGSGEPFTTGVLDYLDGEQFTALARRVQRHLENPENREVHEDLAVMEGAAPPKEQADG
jgi:hypothetical protein